MKHKIRKELLGYGPIRILLIGCGGTGSQILTGLARLHCAMLSRGHRDGLTVFAMDPDTVSEANVGRQLFSPSDVGRHKSTVLIDRINQYYGLSWESEVGKMNSSLSPNAKVYISCVDTRASRNGIHASLRNNNHWAYIMDTGNGAHNGQVLLGERVDRRYSLRKQLPCPYDLFPDLADKSIPEDDQPSCSLAESLTKQSLFVNQAVATHALQMLTDLLFEGGLNYHGVFFDMKRQTSNPLPVDWKAWERIQQGITKKGTK